MKRIYAVILLLILSLGLIDSVKAVTVCASGCDVTSIADALVFEFNGQTITVSPGTYNESGLRIQNRTLISATPDQPELTIINGTGIIALGRLKTVLRIENATVKGFTIMGGNAKNKKQHSIYSTYTPGFGVGWIARTAY